MAAIEADTSLLLFLVGQPFMGGRIAGALDLKRLDVGQPSDRGLTLTLEPRPPQTDPPADARLVWLRAWIESTATSPRVYGRIDIEPSERLQFAPNAPTASWQAVGLDRGAQDLEIARAMLLIAEDRRRDDAGRVVDRADEDEFGTAPLELVMASAVELEERALGAIRGRRLRQRGERRRRGLAMPSARRIVRRLSRLMAIPSRSARSSLKWLSLIGP